MKFLIKPLVVAVSITTLTACVSSTSSTHRPTKTVSSIEKATTAKDELHQATRSLLRSSFAYQTDVYVSNQIRREALERATVEQLSSYDDITQQCNHEHDEAYVALLRVAKADGKTIDDEQYTTQKDDIKKAFLACQKELDHQHTFEFSDDDLLNSETMMQALSDMIEESHQSSKVHDSDHTALDAKKARLVHDYLIKPSSMAMVGSYEPLKGVISALPSVSYEAKNLKFHLNQPVYIDWRAGGIYLWADNFALANSQALDKTLGDKWKDKWLFLPINDGSLPENFTKDLMKAIKHAQSERFLALPKQDFLKGGVDLALTHHLPEDKQTLINNTPHIIRLSSHPKDRAYANYVFYATLYDDITTNYPSLLPTPFSQQEYEMADGDSVIKVINKPSTQDATSPSDDKPTINSRFLVKLLLNRLQNRMTDFEDAIVQTDKPNQYLPMTQYGIIDGKIVWLHHRRYPTNSLKTGQWSQTTHDEPLVIDVFTQILPNKQMAFDRLPNHAKLPNAQNTINFFDYKDNLENSLKNSDDKYLKRLSSLLFGGVDTDVDDDSFEP